MKMAKRNSLSGKTLTGNLEILPKHRENMGNLVCSNCKVKNISIFAAKIYKFFESFISLPSQFCVCKHHKSGTGKICDKTGKTENLKMQFEWVHCTLQISNHNTSHETLIYRMICYYIF